MTPTALSPLAAWVRSVDATPDLAIALEDVGYGAIWLGGSPRELDVFAPLLDSTQRLVVATGIVNIWASPASDIAEKTLRMLDRFPDRFLLGIGAGHPEVHTDAKRPLEGVSRYLDVLDAAGVPAERIVLAALGDKMLTLAAERSAGAHPYLTTPEHSQHAREVLGAGPLLIPEQRVVLSTDPVQARAVGRPSVASPYLRLENYVRNWRTLGFTDDDLAGDGSDTLIDALVAWGDDDTVAARLRAHLDAGADQVAVQALGSVDENLATFARVATAFGSARA